MEATMAAVIRYIQFSVAVGVAVGDVNPIWPLCEGADFTGRCNGSGYAVEDRMVSRRSAGVSHPSVFRGRELSSAATWAR
jgi:hypothetical protein